MGLLASFPPILQWLFVIVLGLAFGSFTTVLATRKNFWTLKDKTRSACPECGAKLGIKDLLPLLSWLCARGRCRHCSGKISPLYPLSELSVVLMGGLYFACDDYTSLPELLVVYFAISALVALAVHDLRERVLPNALLVILAVTGVLYHFLLAQAYAPGQDGVVEYGAGALIYGALAWFLAWFMEKIMKKKAMGMGDVKFFAVSGLWLGLSNLGLFCILGGACGVVFSVLWKKIRNEEYFPFGPALITSFFIVLLFG